MELKGNGEGGSSADRRLDEGGGYYSFAGLKGEDGWWWGFLFSGVGGGAYIFIGAEENKEGGREFFQQS